jgi:tripartite-type tricarboxylate transporter receptor subunit TctC
MKHRSILLKTAALLIATSVTANAQSTAEFYSAHNISIIVGYTPGSGYDLYARLLARHYGKYIPGQPRIIVQNMPGGGSLTAANHVAQAAPRDGTVLGVINRSLPIAALLQTADPKTILYDAFTLNYIGSMSEETTLAFTWAKTGVTKFEQLRDRQITTGTQGVASDGFVFSSMLNSMFGTKIRVILGYTGTDKIYFAMEKGELDSYVGGTLGSLMASHPDWIKEGKVNVLVQLSVRRSQMLPDVPTIIELAEDETQRAAIGLVLAPQRMGRPVIAPPSLPADRLFALQKAFDETMKDETMLGEAERMKAEISPMTGPEMRDFVRQLHEVQPDALAIARHAVKAPG